MKQLLEHITLDLNLSDMDDLEVLERMREAQPHLPVIINSGFDCHGSCACPVAAFVLKSSDLTELICCKFNKCWRGKSHKCRGRSKPPDKPDTKRF